MKNENIPYGTRKPIISDLIWKGLSNAQIWHATGFEPEYIAQIRSRLGAENFCEELKRHAEFFKGLSPREEYTKHAELRKTIDEF